MRFTLVDVLIVIAVIFAASSGYRRGFWLSLAQYAGLLAGVVVGAGLAPLILNALNVHDSTLRSLAAILILIVAGTIGSSIGFWVGEPIRLRLLARPQSGRADSVGGAIFSAIAVLSVSWFLGLSLARVPSPALSISIQRSAILRTLDAFFPRPPTFLAQVEGIIAGVNFPSAFTGLEPTPSPQPLPQSIDTAGVRKAEAETLRIQGYGCGGIVFGSGFPVAPGMILTNAHVVAGTTGTSVQDGAGDRPLSARVVLFDPERDVAILYVPRLGSSLPALPEAAADAGTQGAAIGYPGGGQELGVPAVIDGQVRAEGYDIYNQNKVVREIWITEADVKPGNSGGPLVNLNGAVVGVIFAASTSNPGQAYALTDAEVQPDIDAAQGKTQPVPVGQCAM